MTRNAATADDSAAADGEEGAWVLLDDAEAAEAVAQARPEAEVEEAALRATVEHQEHRQRVTEELRHACEAHGRVQRAIEAVRELATVASVAAVVHPVCFERLCLVAAGPGMRVASVQEGSPVCVRTQEPHMLQTGQQVIISGVPETLVYSASGPTWAAVLNGLRVVIVRDECRFAVQDVDATSVTDDIDFTSAEVAPHLTCWEKGHAPLLHNFLLETARVTGKIGVLLVGRTVWLGVRWACKGAQGAAQSSLLNLSKSLQDEQDIPTTLKLAALMSDGAAKLFAWGGPDIDSAAHKLWTSAIQVSQPAFWQVSRATVVCAECLRLWCECVAKHHCRHCGRLVCNECALSREPVPWNGCDGDSPVCQACVKVVKMRNLATRSFHDLKTILNMQQLQASSCTPEQEHAHIWAEIVANSSLPPTRARGKGKARGPPPPPMPPTGKGKDKGKGKGEGRGKGRTECSLAGAAAKSVGRKLGLSVLDDEDGEVDALARQWTLRPLSAQRQAATAPAPRAAPSGEEGVRLLEHYESLRWKVFWRKCSVHLDQIVRCLSEPQVVESALAVDPWLMQLEQVLPLDDTRKLGEASFEKLKQAARGQYGPIEGLRIYERIICEHFFPVPHLGARLRAVRSLCDLAAEHQRLTSTFHAALLSYRALILEPTTASELVGAVAPTEALAEAPAQSLAKAPVEVPTEELAAPRLREEVHGFLKFIRKADKSPDLGAVALKGTTANGRRLFDYLWREGGELGPSFVACVTVAVSTLDAAVGDGAGVSDAAKRMQSLAETAVAIKRLSDDLSADVATAQSLGGVARKLDATLADLREGFEVTLAAGRLLLQGFGELPERTGQETLCRDLDRCIKNLREILGHLRRAQDRIVQEGISSTQRRFSGRLVKRPVIDGSVGCGHSTANSAATLLASIAELARTAAPAREDDREDRMIVQESETGAAAAAGGDQEPKRCCAAEEVGMPPELESRKLVVLGDGSDVKHESSEVLAPARPRHSRAGFTD